MVIALAAALSAALVTAAPDAPPGAAASIEQDLRCYRLMASVAADQDETVRGFGIAAAQFFLGRIDAAVPGFDPASAQPAEGAAGDGAALLARCSEAMGAAGFDARALGASLEAPASSI